MRPAIVLFAKAPVPGRVKTRLQPPLTAHQAAELHSAFVLDMIAKAERLSRYARLELHTDTHTDAWSSSGVTRRLQTAGDLGCKMRYALENLLEEGAPRVLIAGTDAPTLPAAHLLELLRSPADVALGPCADGGYYAISCRHTHPAMFDGVPWSSPGTLRESVLQARRCGLTVDLGPSWYDIDSAAELELLTAEASLPAHTAAWVQEYMDVNE